MSNGISVPVSYGEVLDKITILEIKSERISDENKLINVRHELKVLSQTWCGTVADESEISEMRIRLKVINEALWEIEDDIRDKEGAKEFDDEFIRLARAVYVTNDHDLIFRYIEQEHTGVCLYSFLSLRVNLHEYMLLITRPQVMSVRAYMYLLNR